MVIFLLLAASNPLPLLLLRIVYTQFYKGYIWSKQLRQRSDLEMWSKQLRHRSGLEMLFGSFYLNEMTIAIIIDYIFI